MKELDEALKAFTLKLPARDDDRTVTAQEFVDVDKDELCACEPNAVNPHDLEGIANKTMQRFADRARGCRTVGATRTATASPRTRKIF